MAGMIYGDDLHVFTQTALKITAEINGAYHTIEENRALMEELTGRGRRKELRKRWTW